MDTKQGSIKRGQWWRRISSGYPYCVQIVRDGRVMLLNDIGMPDGSFGIEEFREQFYNIRELKEDA